MAAFAIRGLYVDDDVFFKFMWYNICIKSSVAPYIQNTVTSKTISIHFFITISMHGERGILAAL